jgi:hypothetical protein
MLGEASAWPGPKLFSRSHCGVGVRETKADVKSSGCGGLCGASSSKCK